MFVAPLHELVVGFQQVVLDVGPAEHSPPRQRQNTPRRTSCATHCASERSSGTANYLRTSRQLHATLSSKGQAAQVHATRIQRNRLPPLDIQHEADRTRSAADALDDHALRGRSHAIYGHAGDACGRPHLVEPLYIALRRCAENKHARGNAWATYTTACARMVLQQGKLHALLGMQLANETEGH